MKIAQVVPSLLARHGGPSRSVRGLAGGLAQIGHTVDLLTTGPLEADTNAVTSPAPDTLKTHAFDRDFPQLLARSSALDRHLAANAYTVIHNHGLWLRPLHYAHRAARQSAVPLVISPRGMMSPWAWQHRRWKKRLASWLIHPGAFAGATGWHATCEAEADDIRRLGFRQPICVAPNAVVPPSAAAEAGEAQPWRARLPALAGRRMALFYSRFHAKKRVIELIDLWLAKPRGDWVLLIAGIPESYSVAQLDAYIERNGGAGRILVRDGAGQPPPYAACDLFLLPSHSENFGLVVAEALVRGVPVLTTDGSPWKELETVGAGRCVPWADFGPAMDALLTEPSEALTASGERGRRWACATFTWEKTAHTLADFYASLTAPA
jgi:glycosyltransferase involved in cell wall biosynthesis